MDGLSPDKTDVADAAPKVDPKLLFAFLFGSDKFRDYVGRLAAATSAAVGDTDELSPADARLIQIRRVKRLALTLAAKVQAWVDAGENKEAQDEAKARWSKEAQELSTASYGIQMVHTIGNVRIGGGQIHIQIFVMCNLPILLNRFLSQRFTC